MDGDGCRAALGCLRDGCLRSSERTRKGDVVTATRLHVGASGWTCDSWSGVFYPKEVKAAERLSYYAGKFDTVEVNAAVFRELLGQP